MSTLNMRLTPQSDRRRSQRVLLSIAVRISGTNVSGVGFAEDTSTVMVNAHGGLVLVKTAVHLGQRLKIRNLNTGEETSCIAVDANVETGEAREVGMEFAAAAPRFWRISFPPVDWNSRSAEAKRFRQATPARKTMPPPTVKK